MNFKKTILSASIALLFSFSANAAIIDFIGVKANDKNVSIIENSTSYSEVREKRVINALSKVNNKFLSRNQAKRGSFGVNSGHFYNEKGSTSLNLIADKEIPNSGVQIPQVWIPVPSIVGNSTLISSSEWSPLPETINMGLGFIQERTATYSVTYLDREQLEGTGTFRVINTRTVEETVNENRGSLGTKQINDPDNTPGFALAPNGVTATCDGVTIGEIGKINGIDYLVVDNGMMNNVLYDAYEGIKSPLYDEICTSNVTDMSGTLSYFNYGRQTPFAATYNISAWDTKNVTNMSEMFSESKFLTYDLSYWDVSKVTDMSEMFSGSDFNGSLNNWQTSSLRNMESMFSAGLFNQPINHFDVSNVENMAYMFAYAQSFNQDISNWDFSSILSEENLIEVIQKMSKIYEDVDDGLIDESTGKYISTGDYAYPVSLETFDFYYENIMYGVSGLIGMFAENPVYDQDISLWNVQHIKVKPYFFQDLPQEMIDDMGSPNFETKITKLPPHWLLNGKIETASNGVTKTCLEERPGTFVNYEGDVYFVANNELLSMAIDSTLYNNFEVPALFQICTTHVTNSRLSGAYQEYNNSLKLYEWDTSNIVDMSGMFANSEGVGDISLWDTSKVQSMVGMFAFSDFNGFINDWNTSNLLATNIMFYNNYSFNQPLDNWNTSKLLSTASMFENAYSFNQPLNSWNTSNVFNMEAMFRLAYNFNQPLNNWNFSKIGTGLNPAFITAEREIVDGFMNELNNLGLLYYVPIDGNLMSMFANAYSYAQDISLWNVDNIPEKPNNFDLNAIQITKLPSHWLPATYEYTFNDTYWVESGLYESMYINGVRVLHELMSNGTLSTYEAGGCLYSRGNYQTNVVSGGETSLYYSVKKQCQ